MAGNVRIGVRYCGGCNPRYDRVALVKQVAGCFPGVDFVPAQPGEHYPAALVVCGCPALCVNVEWLDVPDGGLLYPNGPEDVPALCERLSQMIQSMET